MEQCSKDSRITLICVLAPGCLLDGKAMGSGTSRHHTQLQTLVKQVRIPWSIRKTRAGNALEKTSGNGRGDEQDDMRTDSDRSMVFPTRGQ